LKDYVYKLSNLAPRKALIQFSFNDYMYDKKEESELIKKYKKFINRLKSRYQIEIFSSFDKDKGKVKEGEYVYEKLGLDFKTSFVSVMSLANKNFNFKGYGYAIVNSYHTYILARRRFTCPIYFIALNEYYHQKAEALKYYGILSDAYIVSDIKQLEKISVDRKVDNKLDADRGFGTMFEVAQKVEEEVRNLLSYLNDKRK